MSAGWIERLRKEGDPKTPVQFPYYLWPFLCDVVEAAEEVSRIEATGVLPDFQSQANALAALRTEVECDVTENKALKEALVAVRNWVRYGEGTESDAAEKMDAALTSTEDAER